MEIIGIVIVVAVILVVLVYIANRKGQALWRKIIAEFLLYYPFNDLMVVMRELMTIAPESENPQSSLAGVYIHTTITFLAETRQTGVNNRDNIFVIIKGSLYLCQLFYANYQRVVMEIKVDGISDKPLEYFDFMDKVHEVRMALRKA